MPRYAIGDIQGCLEPLRTLLDRVAFNVDRDRLLLVGDLVNRGPDSLGVLRFVRSLGAAVQTVLGNHDLHLLALHHDPARRAKDGDTLDAVLAAPDRDMLLQWLLEQPLLIDDPEHGDLFVHAGLVPGWTLADALANARAAEAALRAEPAQFLASMYGNRPDRWEEAHTPMERHRFTINVLTRLRYCRADGRIDLKLKHAPHGEPGPYRPWFEHANRRLAGRRVVCGHWSTLGFVHRPDLLALDTGCVWGGALTAVDLDDPEAPVRQQPCRGCGPGGE